MQQFLTIFLSSFVIALSGALMPGPLLTATISESSRRGFIAGPLLILGHGLLELLLVAALLLGLAPLFNQDGFFITVALAGAAFLLWMGVSMLRELPTLSLALEPESGQQRHLVLTGILLSLANPYFVIWWATIGLGYIFYCLESGLWGLVFFFCGHILADLAWYAVVAITVDRGKRFFNDRLYRGIIGGCALLLLIFACYFAYSGLDRLLQA